MAQRGAVTRCRRNKARPGVALGVLAALAAAAALPGIARAQVLVNGNAVFNGTQFDYSYSVVNNTALQLAIVSINVFALPDAVLNPAAPEGFLISFDPGVGLVSFLEDNEASTPQTFAPGSTVGFFTFQSAFAPNPSSFEALDIEGNSFTGQTIAPAPAVAAPEPATLALLGMVSGAQATALFVRRRRSSAS